MSSINLQAVNAYSQVSRQNSIGQTAAQQMQEAANFQELVRANMQQISATKASNVQDSASISNVAAGSSVIGVLKEKLLKQENVALKSMVGEASTLDVVTASAEAKQTLDIITKLRNEMQQALDKILNMSI